MSIQNSYLTDLEPEDHIPEILAMFAPQLFLTRAKYDKISAEMKKSHQKIKTQLQICLILI